MGTRILEVQLHLKYLSGDSILHGKQIVHDARAALSYQELLEMGLNLMLC